MKKQVHELQTKASKTKDDREKKNAEIIKKFDDKLLQFAKDKLKLEDELKIARMKSFSDVNDQKSKFGKKAAPESSKSKTTLDKDVGQKSTQYDALVNELPSRETHKKFVGIIMEKEKSIDNLNKVNAKYVGDAQKVKNNLEDDVKSRDLKIKKLGEDIKMW